MNGNTLVEYIHAYFEYNLILAKKELQNKLATKFKCFRVLEICHGRNLFLNGMRNEVDMT